MNRSEFVERVSEHTGVPAANVAKVIDGLRDVAVDAIQQGDKITLPGILTIERVSRAERQGRNPRTGEPMTLPAGFSAKITPGQTLKSAAKAAAKS